MRSADARIWDGGIAASSIPSQASVVSAGGACGRCSRPLHRDMPQRVPSGDAIPATQWTAWCRPPLPPGEAASSPVCLAASAQTPRFAPVQTQQLPLRGP